MSTPTAAPTPSRPSAHRGRRHAAPEPRIAVPTPTLPTRLSSPARAPGTSRSPASWSAMMTAARSTQPPLFTVPPRRHARRRGLGPTTFRTPGARIAGDRRRQSVSVAARVARTTIKITKEREQFGRAIRSTRPSPTPARRCFLGEAYRSVTLWAASALDHDPDAGVPRHQLRQGLRLRRHGQRRPAPPLPGPRRHRFTWNTISSSSSTRPKPCPAPSRTPARTASRSPPHCSRR